MQNRDRKKAILLLLLRDNFIHFLLGIFGIFVWLKFTSYLPNKYWEFLCIAVGYGVYFYLTTPFLLYWLAYASTDQLTQSKLLITVGVVGVYSYIIWDSYFFFKDTIQSLISAISIGEF